MRCRAVRYGRKAWRSVWANGASGSQGSAVAETVCRGRVARFGLLIARRRRKGLQVCGVGVGSFTSLVAGDRRGGRYGGGPEIDSGGAGEAGAVVVHGAVAATFSGVPGENRY